MRCKGFPTKIDILLTAQRRDAGKSLVVIRMQQVRSIGQFSQFRKIHLGRHYGTSRKTLKVVTTLESHQQQNLPLLLTTLPDFARGGSRSND